MNSLRNSIFSCAVLAILILASGLWGCATQRLQAESAALKANDSENLLEKQVAAARVEKTAPDPLPKMTDADHERLGDGYFSQGKLELACVQYERALQHNPHNIRIYYKKGLLFLGAKMPKAAVQEFQQVIKAQPDHALAHQGLGQAFFHMNKCAEAETHFKKALDLDATLWKAHNFLGVIYDYQGNHEMAIGEYEAAITLNASSGFLYNNLGVSYSLAGKYEKAIHAFSRALEIGRSPRIYNNVGLVLSKLGRYEEAFEAFRKAGGEAEAYNNLGCVYLQQGELEKAIHSFEKAIALKPAFYAKAGENLRKATMDYSTDNEGRRFRHADSKGDQQYIPQSLSEAKRVNAGDKSSRSVKPSVGKPTHGPSNTSRASETKKSAEEIAALFITRETYDKASHVKKPSEESTGSTAITMKQERTSPENPQKHLVREKIYSDHSEYVGEWKDNTRHGHGTLMWPNGVKYIGEFDAGRATGGWMSTDDAEKTWAYQNYEGDWIILQRDKPD